MFATLLAALAVAIALQALRLASRDRIVIQVHPDTPPTSGETRLSLPWFLDDDAKAQITHLTRSKGGFSK